MPNVNSNKKVLFLPNWTEGNPYLLRLSEALENHGVTVEFSAYPNSMFGLCTLKKRYPGIDVVHLHWLGPLIGKILWAGSPIKFKLRLLAFLFELGICRLQGLKIVWTLHNRIEHESTDPKKELVVRRLLSLMVNKVHFHSKSAMHLLSNEYSVDFEKKGFVAEHGNYSNDYPIDKIKEEALAKKLNIAPNHHVFLFFGNIRKYKGLEDLINGFNSLTKDNVRLVIAGRVMSEQDAEFVLEAGKVDERIITMLGFVDDCDVGPLLSLSTSMVLPYTSTLTSGVASLAMSFGLPLVLPEKARVFDVPGDEGAEYFTEGNIGKALKTIQARDLELMGKHNLGLSKEHSWDNMAKKIMEAYTSN